MLVTLLICVIYWIYDGPVKEAEKGWPLFFSVASRVLTVVTAVSLFALLAILLLGDFDALARTIESFFYSTQYAGETVGVV